MPAAAGSLIQKFFEPSHNVIAFIPTSFIEGKMLGCEWAEWYSATTRISPNHKKKNGRCDHHRLYLLGIKHIFIQKLVEGGTNRRIG